jgi:hypothetical protein
MHEARNSELLTCEVGAAGDDDSQDGAGIDFDEAAPPHGPGGAVCPPETGAHSHVQALMFSRFPLSETQVYTQQVLRCCLQLLVCGKSTTVSTDWVKPAYIFNEADFRNTVCNPAVRATPVIARAAEPPATSSPPPAARTTRSCSHVHFPARFNT